jgi:hypothetical protein
MKEVLHIHPAAAFNLERVLLMGGRTINGQFVPAGTIVSMVGWVIQNRYQLKDWEREWEPENHMFVYPIDL